MSASTRAKPRLAIRPFPTEAFNPIYRVEWCDPTTNDKWTYERAFADEEDAKADCHRRRQGPNKRLLWRVVKAEVVE